MADTKSKRRVRREPRVRPDINAPADQYGQDVRLMDLKAEAWSLRVRGWSFRAIGKEMGVCPATAWRYCQDPEGGLAKIDGDQVVRQQILQGHRMLLDHLVGEIEEQRLNGQRIIERDANGNEKVTIKPLNHQMVAEAGRCLDRAARLLGLLDGPIDGSGSTTNTTIVLTSPSDGASFEQKWANADAAVDVTAHSATEQPPEAAFASRQ